MAGLTRIVPQVENSGATVLRQALEHPSASVGTAMQ